MMSIESFVRDTLGCQCSAEVFRDVSVTGEPEVFDGMAGSRLVALGGRLLVLTVPVDPENVGEERFGVLLERGRALRDEGGFNRFRLVLVTPDAATAADLLQRCDSVGGRGEERLHLHVVPAAAVPPELR